MSFKVHTVDDGHNLPIEYRAAGEITAEIGLALTCSAGLLVEASGTDLPAYICMTARPCKSGEMIPVVRVGPDVIWETSASVAMTGVKPGGKVSLSTDGLSVTATAGGCAEIVAMEGTAAGSTVYVRFSQPAASAKPAGDGS